MDGRDGRFREIYRDFMPLSTRGEDDSFIVKWMEILGRNFRCAGSDVPIEIEIARFSFDPKFRPPNYRPRNYVVRVRT